MSLIEFGDFQKVEMRVGKIIAAEINPKAKIPAYIVKLDFGAEIGHKISSAQLTQHYQPSDLIDRYVVCVMNFPPKRVAGIKSEVLILAAVSDSCGTRLLFVDEPIELGSVIA